MIRSMRRVTMTLRRDQRTAEQQRDVNSCATSAAALQRDKADERFAEMIRGRVAAIVDKPKSPRLTREEFLEQTTPADG